MKVCLILFFLFANTFAQVENAVEDRSLLTLPVFYYDLLCFDSPDAGKTRLDVFVQVPHNQIQFLKSQNKFKAEYLVTVSVFDENRLRLLTEKSWSEKIEVADFDLTIARNSSNLSLRSFVLEPAKYFIRIEVEDKDSRKAFTYNSPFEVRNLDKRISISDVMLIANKTIIDGSSKIVPNVSGNIAQQKGGIPIFFEIYSDSVQTIILNYTVVDKNQFTIYSNTVNYNLKEGRNQVFYYLDTLNAAIGEYLFKVNVQNQNHETFASASKNIISRLYGIPSSIKDLDKAIEQMIYIGNTADIEHIRAGSAYESKLDRFLAFWKKKDHNPVTPDNEIFNEYYRRVEYANKTFSNYADGWKSDMGMVYIILGAPNNVDRHPFDYNSKPYEIWEYYNINSQFVFIDRTGFGDYRLVTPLQGDNYRFR